GQPPFPVRQRQMLVAHVRIDALGHQQAARDLRLDRIEMAGDGGEHAAHGCFWPAGQATLTASRPCQTRCVPCNRRIGPGVDASTRRAGHNRDNGGTSPGPPSAMPRTHPMTRRTFPTILLATTLALGGCGGSGDQAAPVSAAAVDLGAPSRVEEWPLPASLPGSASPSLATTPDGKLLLGWINSQKGRRHIFQFSTFAPDWGRWMHAMSTVAVGNSMFVNWAD